MRLPGEHAALAPVGHLGPHGPVLSVLDRSEGVEERRGHDDGPGVGPVGRVEVLPHVDWDPEADSGDVGVGDVPGLRERDDEGRAEDGRPERRLDSERLVGRSGSLGVAQRLAASDGLAEQEPDVALGQGRERAERLVGGGDDLRGDPVGLEDPLDHRVVGVGGRVALFGQFLALVPRCVNEVVGHVAVVVGVDDVRDAFDAHEHSASRFQDPEEPLIVRDAESALRGGVGEERGAGLQRPVHHHVPQARAGAAVVGLEHALGEQLLAGRRLAVVSEVLEEVPELRGHVADELAGDDLRAGGADVGVRVPVGIACVPCRRLVGVERCLELADALGVLGGLLALSRLGLGDLGVDPRDLVVGLGGAVLEFLRQVAAGLSDLSQLLEGCALFFGGGALLFEKLLLRGHLGVSLSVSGRTRRTLRSCHGL